MASDNRQSGHRKMVNTTVESIVWRMAKLAAVREGVTLRAFVERALRAEIRHVAGKARGEDENRTRGA